MLSNGRVYTEVIPKASKWILQRAINTFVPKGSTVVTDGWYGYKGLHENYEHKVVDHHRGEYVKGGYHTNSIEGFWSQLKRGIVGVTIWSAKSIWNCIVMNLLADTIHGI